ncbi:MAG TPA: hypothetical protein VGJ18_14155 [Gemmatimonadaceae bacterium]
MQPIPTPDLQFSYRTARSTAITTAIIAVVLIESVAVHFAVAVRHLALAWGLTLSSLLAILWLVRDYVALGAGAVRVSADEVHLTIGRRFKLDIPLRAIARVISPTFRDLPTPGTTQGRDFVNLTKPAAPNVLLGLEETRRIRIATGIGRDVKRIALKLDDPRAFISAIEARRAALAARSA